MPARHANLKDPSSKDSVKVMAGGPARHASKPSVFLFFFILLLMLTIGAANIYIYFAQKPKTIIVDTTLGDTAFWEKIKTQNPTYRDAYLVLSKIKAKEGDVLSSEDFKKEALEVDPFTPL